MGDDRVDALVYVYRHLFAQEPRVGPLPDSFGYCSWCHEIVECYQKDWASGTPGPTCNLPDDDEAVLCCAMPLHRVQEESHMHQLVWASYQLGGIHAARATWADHGRPRLANKEGVHG